MGKPKLRAYQALTALVKSADITDTSKGISNCFATLGYLMSPYDALCHSGLLDFRSRTGSSGYAVILSERSAAMDIETVAQALGRSCEEVKHHLDKL